MLNNLEKYQIALGKLQKIQPGRGQGYHSEICRISWCARKAGINSENVVQEIIANTSTKGRVVPMREIKETVANVYRIPFCQMQNKRWQQQKSNHKFDDKSFDAMIGGHIGVGEKELIAASPCHIPDDPCRHGETVLSVLYGADDILFIGPATSPSSEYVKTVSVHLESIQHGDYRLPSLPHIVINPLKGHEGLCKDGLKMSLRADSCVAEYRFAVVEFDSIPIEKQYAFWACTIQNNFPVAALVHSGGKSIHGWVRVNCKNIDEWRTRSVKTVSK